MTDELKNPALRILVVGAGATGGYFGGRLTQNGRDVTFLVRAARGAQLERDGLRIVSPLGDATVRPRLVRAGAFDETYDLVLFTVKAFALDQAIADVAPAVGPATTILPVLNGMRHVEVLAERFGDAAVLGGVCVIPSTLEADGTIRHLADLAELTYGERPGGTSPRIERVDRALRGAGFDTRLSTDITSDMWQKWVLLASLGGINALMRGTVGEVAAVPGGRAFAVAFIDECAAIASAHGYPIPATARERAEGLLTAAGSPQTSSMYRDLAGGHDVESEHILGDLLARGRAAEVVTPLLAAAYANLTVYRNRLLGNAVPRTVKA